MTAILDRLTRAFHFPTDFMARRALRRLSPRRGTTALPFSPSAFSASVGVWDVRPSRTSRRAAFVGGRGVRRALAFEWSVTGSNVSEDGAVLRVALPGRVTRSMGGVCNVVNAGVPALALWKASAGDAFIQVFATANGDRFVATDRRDTSTDGRVLIEVMPR